MNSKTIVSVSYKGDRYKVRKVFYSSEFVKFDILQNRRIVKGCLLTERSAILELLNILRIRVFTE